jgi:citrate lyase subunit beta/citryl-CoA lyase
MEREENPQVNRSFLFAPGNVPRRVEKALTLDADAVILDLEDSVALSDKAATRKPVAEALGRPRRCRAYVRVNAASTPFCYRDLVETVRPGMDGVIVPKIESAADLHAVDWLLANLEREQELAEGSIDLMPIIETAAGVQRVDRILQARNLRPYRAPWRVKRVAFGAGDYANDVGLSPTLEEQELSDARARLVLASRAAGMENPIDSPWFHFKESEAFRRALERSRRGGFQGRLCVHPDQIGPVNAAYLPSEEEIASAQRIVSAFREAEARGSAAIQVDGQMIDYPIVYRAQALLEAVSKAKLK